MFSATFHDRRFVVRGVLVGEWHSGPYTKNHDEKWNCNTIVAWYVQANTINGSMIQ